MRKFGIFSSFIFISILVAVVYGILHDQITYSISPEYFTKFKYKQFGFEPEWFGGHRQTVAAIGFLATWWMGLFIGIPLGLISFLFPDHKTMTVILSKSISIVITITVVTAVIGFMYGRFYLTKTGVDWWRPDDLIDRPAFITVGSIHNFSYLGGIIGLLASITYLLFRKVRSKQN